MNEIKIELSPSGAVLVVKAGSQLRDVLAPEYAEFACDGQSQCGSCRVQLIEGSLPVTPLDAEVLPSDELAAGWRLACQAVVSSPLRLRCQHSNIAILGDSENVKPGSRSGLGIAVDLGTTTLVAQLLELSTGKVLAERSALNPQTKWGADVMTRVRCALDGIDLTSVIREFLGTMIGDLIGRRGSEVRDIVLVGNTVMHHLFSGITVGPLSHVPFASPESGEQRFSAQQLNWPFENCCVRFLACIGGFVGSDVLAGIHAVGLHQSESLGVLIDLGTNGEIAIGNRDRILCASTAAGSAFEAGSIRMGMRAATGAISRVLQQNGHIHCEVIGGGIASGICGSGLVDAVAVVLDLGILDPSGRLCKGAKCFALDGNGNVKLYQQDIRELQLAKGAVSAGVSLLLKHLGRTIDEVGRVYLAGAFGNYVSPASAVRIGLLEMPVEKIFPSGNSALRGAKMALVSGLDSGAKCIEHLELASDPDFQDTFVSRMGFPDKANRKDVQLEFAI